MAEAKPRLIRLTTILTQLQSKRIITAKEIAEKHQVSIRTVYRDIRTLEKSGIPIVTEEGKGYSIMEGYKIPPIMFTQAITKIKSVLQYTQKEKTELLTNRIQVRNNDTIKKTSNYLIQLQSSIANYQTLKIEYVSLDKNKSQRAIEPFALYTTQDDNWILIAFCTLRNDFRAFRLDCIQKIQASEDHFEPHQITLQEYFKKCSEKYIQTPDTPMT